MRRSSLLFKAFCYPSTERQLKSSLLDNVNVKFNDMISLNSCWYDWAQIFLSKESQAIRKFKTPDDDFAHLVSNWSGQQDSKNFNPVTLAHEVQDIITNAGIDCLISGSLSLYTITQPRITKDIDFNVNGDLSKLQDLFISKGHHMSNITQLYPKNSLPKFKTEHVNVSVLTYKDIRMDLYLNSCSVTQWAHDSAIVIQNRRYLSPECLAFFKLFAIDPKYVRYHKDLDDLILLLHQGINDKIVADKLIEVFGSNCRQLVIWNKLIKQVDAKY